MPSEKKHFLKCQNDDFSGNQVFLASWKKITFAKRNQCTINANHWCVKHAENISNSSPIAQHTNRAHTLQKPLCVCLKGKVIWLVFYWDLYPKGWNAERESLLSRWFKVSGVWYNVVRKNWFQQWLINHLKNMEKLRRIIVESSS